MIIVLLIFFLNIFFVIIITSEFVWTIMGKHLIFTGKILFCDNSNLRVSKITSGSLLCNTNFDRRKFTKKKKKEKHFDLYGRKTSISIVSNRVRWEKQHRRNWITSRVFTEQLCTNRRLSHFQKFFRRVQIAMRNFNAHTFVLVTRALVLYSRVYVSLTVARTQNTSVRIKHYTVITLPIRYVTV